MPAPTLVDASQVAAEALSWEGVPWRHKGRGRTGIDCGGLLLAVGWELGIWPRSFDIQIYPRQPDGSIKAQLMDAGFTPVSDDLAGIPVGAALLMAPGSPRFPYHLAIMAQGNLVVHAHAPRRRVVVHSLRGKFATQVQTVYRYPGVDYER